MSIVEKACREEGLKLVGDMLPKDKRQVKVFQRLIAAVRRAEAEMQDVLSASERQTNDSLRREILKDDRIRFLEAKLLQVEMKSRLDDIQALTAADKTRLLEAANGIGK
jgi:hypothetical protein